MRTFAGRGLRELHVPFLKQEAELLAQRDELLDPPIQLIQACPDELANGSARRATFVSHIQNSPQISEREPDH